MNWQRTIFRAAPALAAGALSACSLFSQTPSDDTVRKIHEAVYAGIAGDEAEARLSSLGFRCLARTGDYYDEDGRLQTAPRLLLCAREPREIGFYCENRDEVVVVLKENFVDSVSVSRRPSCERQ